MTRIDSATVEHLGRLARLELEPDEIARLVTEMTLILEHFTALEEVDTPIEVGPQGRGLTSVLRLDSETAEPLASEPVSMASESRGNLYVVPRLAAMSAQAEDA